MPGEAPSMRDQLAPSFFHFVLEAGGSVDDAHEGAGLRDWAALGSAVAAAIAAIAAWASVVQGRAL